MVLALLLQWAVAGTDATDDFDLGEDEFAVQGDGDEVDMVDYVEEAKMRPAPPTHFHLRARGQEALTNGFPMQVVSLGPSWVKLELPVLVAQDRASFLREFPHGVQLVTHWDVGGHEVRREQRILPADVWEGSPTWAFFTVACQDARRSAAVRIRVQSLALPDPASANGGGGLGEPKDRYAVTSVFFRPKE